MRIGRSIKKGHEWRRLEEIVMKYESDNSALLPEIVRAIVKEISPEEIYLFGSQARGDAGQDSDIDLLIVEQEPFGPCRSRWGELSRIRRSLSDFHVAKDILVYSRDEVLKWKNSLNHVIGRGLREGKLLYARS